MNEILFYEKPGCLTNNEQKALLRGLGHDVIACNLLAERWSAERLRSFFRTLPVADWFNASAPRIKSGELVPEALSEEQALALMIDEPLLIRRPLIEIGDDKYAGFDDPRMCAQLGLACEQAKQHVLCSSPAPGSACPLPGGGDGGR